MCAAATCGRDRERERRAPQRACGQQRERATREVPRVVQRHVRVDVLLEDPRRFAERNDVRDRERAPEDRGQQRQLAAAERGARHRGRLRPARAERGADAEAREEDGEDQRERVGRRAEQQRQLARPNDLATERGEPGECDGKCCGLRVARFERLSMRRGGDEVCRSVIAPFRGERERERCDAHERISYCGDVARGAHVVDAHQEEPCGDRACDGAEHVAPVEAREPCRRIAAALPLSRDCRQRCAHEHRRRQQRSGCDRAAPRC